MGLFSGAITVKRLRVIRVPDTGGLSVVDLLRGLRSRAAVEVSPDDDPPRTAGWVVAGRPLDVNFTDDNTLFGDWLVAAWRVQELKPSPALVAAEAQRRQDAILAERGTDRLDRAERAELLETVRRELRRKSLPKLSVTDVAWNRSTGRVYVWTHTPRLLDEIREAFIQALGEVPLEEDPFSIAERGEFAEPVVHALPAAFAAAA